MASRSDDFDAHARAEPLVRIQPVDARQFFQGYTVIDIGLGYVAKSLALSGSVNLDAVRLDIECPPIIQFTEAGQALFEGP